MDTFEWYILLSRLGLGINFIQWIALRLYNATQFVAVALFALTPEYVSFLAKLMYLGILFISVRWEHWSSLNKNQLVFTLEAVNVSKISEKIIML